MKKTMILMLILALLSPLPAFGETLTLSFVGDCSIGEMTGSEGKATSYSAVVAEKGMEWPFSLVADWLLQDDFTFANNEVVFTARRQHQDKKFNLKGAPANAQVYLYAGVDAVNTANNHAWDFYEDGYRDTLQALDEAGVPHFGSLYVGTKHGYDDLGVYDVKGIRIGAMGFSYPQDSEGDLKKIKTRVETLREAGCSLVVLSLHWGREEQPSPQSWQFAFARKVIDLGVDVVWGHHPHVLQQVQFYKGKPIFYSTGNFTFGSIKALDPDTGIFQLTYELSASGPQLSRFSVIPCRTQGAGDFRPYALTDPEEKAQMLKKLVYRKAVKGMDNLPDGFADSGTVAVVNGELTIPD